MRFFVFVIKKKVKYFTFHEELSTCIIHLWLPKRAEKLLFSFSLIISSNYFLVRFFFGLIMGRTTKALLTILSLPKYFVPFCYTNIWVLCFVFISLPVSSCKVVRPSLFDVFPRNCRELCLEMLPSVDWGPELCLYVQAA